ncbi:MULTISPECIES: sensor histidine kinase [Ligilactobacillus]|jgi:sensor histidine kinase regulating citrate/malate metabolism|nr:ATP-binding protein [Ligilactobacillus murinus]MBF0831894.1 sensor histidine kinase [Ligilactobacillus murinus]MCR1881209.1 ATP-binding protein [Ligilactobacillus murinus]MCZ0701029.1 ATP-binding protein [Ligilactobacillus murinus]MCZ0706235.1 ATP-binding protein [Ligilactobacillus murinus]WET89208.1 ATP-binding protein [Ligilactobacillus murinus]
MLQHEKLQSDFLRDFLQQAEEIRTLRHDLKNILASITYYAEQKDHIKIKELMTELSENVTFKNKYTGVLALDAVINQKVKAMIAKNIDYGLDLRVPNNLNLGKQELDVCAILGNILDNAIEATTKDIADPSIQLTLIYRKEKLVVKVTNPYLGKKRQNYNKVTVESSKQAGRQGIGLRSIKKRVAKYNGYYDFKVTNGKFTAFVILPLLS